jgi:hypothetical protein
LETEVEGFLERLDMQKAALKAATEATDSSERDKRTKAELAAASALDAKVILSQDLATERQRAKEEAAQHMQFDHAVPGGLSDDERRRIFDEYMDAKDVGPGRAEGGGIDVSDLGLTMDDLFGPMGGL